MAVSHLTFAGAPVTPEPVDRLRFLLDGTRDHPSLDDFIDDVGLCQSLLSQSELRALFAETDRRRRSFGRRRPKAVCVPRALV
jgi:hypothetical protein